jgi:hypothetical protein
MMVSAWGSSDMGNDLLTHASIERSLLAQSLCFTTLFTTLFFFFPLPPSCFIGQKSLHFVINCH